MFPETKQRTLEEIPWIFGDNIVTERRRYSSGDTGDKAATTGRIPSQNYLLPSPMYDNSRRNPSVPVPLLPPPPAYDPRTSLYITKVLLADACRAD